MTTRASDLQGIFQEALTKYQKGEEKHGPFDPSTDTRELLREAESELLDCINYVAMHILKLRTIREKGRK